MRSAFGGVRRGGVAEHSGEELVLDAEEEAALRAKGGAAGGAGREVVYSSAE